MPGDLSGNILALLPRNIVAFLPLPGDILALLPGDTPALLPGDILALLAGNIAALLVRDITALLPGNIPTFLAALGACGSTITRWGRLSTTIVGLGSPAAATTILGLSLIANLLANLFIDRAALLPCCLCAFLLIDSVALLLIDS